MDNINIWFARNKDGNIVTIDKINEDNRYEQYSCPICGSNIIPKAIKEDAQMTRHFAHKDASKCDRETQVHFFIKNELLKQGDKFTIRLGDEVKEFICNEILIEQHYKTEFGIYNPDVTVLTESNETIYFEVANTNKKKIEEYLDIWIELNNIVVEVETKDLINGNIIKEFKSLFYDGKCFNINKEEKDYYETIGSVKTGFKKGFYTKEELDSINWLWKDMNKYLNNELEIDVLSDEIQSIENQNSKSIILNVLRKPMCNKIMDNYLKYNIKKVENYLNSQDENYTFKGENTRLIYDRIYTGCCVRLFYKNKYEYSYKGIVSYSNPCIDDYNKIIEKKNNELMYKNIEKYFKEKKIINNNSSINYYHNKYENEYRIYLNRFYNTYYGKYILMNNKSEEEIKQELDVYINKQMSHDLEIKQLEDLKNILLNKFSKININVFDNGNVFIYINGENKLSYYMPKMEDINTIEKRINREIYESNKLEERIKLLIKYFNKLKRKCKKVKNNYSIHVITHDLYEKCLDINYKGEEVYSIKIKNIDNVYDVINEDLFKKAFVEDIEGYIEFTMLENIIDDINNLYKFKVNRNWNIKYDNENKIIKLYGGNIIYKDNITLDKNIIITEDEQKIYDYIINETSNYIRNYLYGTKEGI